MTDEIVDPETPAEKSVEFSSQVELREHSVIVNYVLANKGKADIYVMDIFPIYDLETREPSVDLNNSVVIWQDPGVVHIVRGLPPYPKEKDMTAYYTPYASKVAAGESIKRKIELSLPLAEWSPYYSPLDHGKYEAESVRKIVLSVHYISSTVEGFEAKDVAFAKDVYFVKSKFLLRDVRKLKAEHSINPIKLLKYPEVFTRTY